MYSRRDSKSAKTKEQVNYCTFLGESVQFPPPNNVFHAAPLLSVGGHACKFPSVSRHMHANLMPLNCRVRHAAINSPLTDTLLFLGKIFSPAELLFSSWRYGKYFGCAYARKRCIQ